MSENSVARQGLRGLLGYFTLRRALVHTSVFVYCLVLFLAFDFAYSSLTRGEEKERSARIANAIYDHGFAADFDGYDVWGELRYRLITDSLGFKDASVRKVPLKSESRRVLLIGDSFAEGIGVSFEDSFAGQLYRAGQERSEKNRVPQRRRRIVLSEHLLQKDQVSPRKRIAVRRSRVVLRYV